MAKTGVLLLNLGTPESPQASDVRKYLHEFLMDPFVIDIPWIARALLVHGIILRNRPEKSAEAYRKIWTERGSPLLFHTLDLGKKVASLLGDEYKVEAIMRYGNPGVRSGLEKLQEAACERVIVFPLYPQYSLAATASSIEKVRKETSCLGMNVEFNFISPFYNDSAFIRCFAENIKMALNEKGVDYCLFSFHGLPERQIRKTDKTGRHCFSSSNCCSQIGEANQNCYRAQSFATAKLIALSLGLKPEQYGVSFQSRLGRTPWIKPYTDFVIPELAQRGVRRLAVISPSFVADCLETLEEIEIRTAHDFKAHGGEELTLVPSLNSTDQWAETVAQIINKASASYRKQNRQI